MLRTTAEAEQTWCPKTRAVAMVNGTIIAMNRNVTDAPNGACMCIHTRCMAWRFFDPEKPKAVQRKSYRIPGACSDEQAEAAARPPEVPASWYVDFDDTWFWMEDDASVTARRAAAADEWLAKRRGYCGAFDKPEIGS